MAELEFLAANPNEYRDSTISVLLPDGPIVRVADVSYLFITSKCPLLSYTFESSLDGGYQACIEVTSEAAMVRLLRYIYTDSYLTSDEESTLNISLLTHVETYKIARDYDLPALQLAANSSLTRAVEISCSVPNPPSGLCDTIRFVYKHLAAEQCLLDTLLNYCVSAFRYHRFGTDPEFQRVAFEIPKFHQDICITNHERDFQDEGKSMSPQSVSSAHSTQAPRTLLQCLPLVHTTGR
ncbi:hypothetical protein BU24DRAFT_199710 [Aaosphaeria arxii CBS 175.79]|uniref:BTB domain-containing protein n=1 Tax=Aaosphaeria arxii CBS 175.79 TaxID=1450172 RepID=A0A6A5XTQ5_9PLEO|nr:uncharacterized protein BU24DRAFT_199710 [Aaosphaeria arxii CBS 175.79]KAF2016333.1 hypothetical protein BU24DRAFT_199710 [Aaosphaeria arxii CBS 175.79]